MRYLPHAVSALVMSLVSLGCPGTNPVECRDQSSCDLFPGGVCLAASTGNQWCAYPDNTCPSGMRYSDQLVGDGLAGMCVEGEDAGVDAPDEDAPVDAGMDAPLPGNWVKIVGGTMIDSVNAVVVAPDGSVIFAASFQGTVDVGGGPLVATDYDIMLARFSSAGEHVWSRRYGGAGTQGAVRLALTSNGEIVLAGSFTGSFVVGTTTLNAVGMADVFVARFTSTGDPVWAVSGGGSAFETVTDMALDDGDNVAVCGEFGNSASFFGGASLSASSTDVYVARLTSGGVHSWSKKLGNSGIDSRCGLDAVAGGDVIVVGDFVDSFSAGGATFTSTSNTRDLFMARFAAANGAHVWSVAPTGSGQENAYDVKVDGSSFYAVGAFNGSLSLGGSPLSAPTSQDAFVGKFAIADAAHQFSTRIGGDDLDRGLIVDTRSDGGVAVAGEFRGTVNFGGVNVMSNGDSDVFIADLDPSTGTVLGVRVMGGGSRDTLLGVDNQLDHAIVAGSFSGTISILGNPYDSAGLLDGFVVRIRR